MNDWNQLENQLRSWAPRPPSAKISARLFPQAAVAAGPDGEAHAEAPAWHWLAPATAALFLLMMVGGRQPAGLGGAAPASRAMMAAFGQPEEAAYYADARHSDHNTWNNLEWTNDECSLTTHRPVFNTNNLTP